MSRFEELADALQFATEEGASDVHFEPGEPPVIRLKGVLVPIEGMSSWSEEDIREALAEIPGLSLERLAEPLQIDFAFTMGTFRWRGHTGCSLGKRTCHLRLLQEKPPSPEDLGLPTFFVERIKKSFGGLFLVTGPTGSGKSTTMAALIQELARTRSLHIVSAEEPVEFLHPRRWEKTGSIVTQVQIPTDCPTFHDAMRGFLRKDPDVIIVGELRDAETVTMALQAAASGHTVMGTLHTRDTIGAVERILSLFPPTEGRAVKSLFACALQAIFAQNLIKRTSENNLEKDRYKKGRILAGELLVTNSIIVSLLLQDKTFNVRNIIEQDPLMYTFDQDLARLVRNGYITLDEGTIHSHNKNVFPSLVRNI